MKYVKVPFTVALMFTLCSTFSLEKEEHRPVYIFGVSASFTGTMVYYTEIQVLDNVALNKNEFLPHRETHSYRLKNYLETDKGQSNRICVIYFSENQKRLEEGAVKVSSKYEKSQSVALEKIDIQSFKLTKPEE